jgi:glycosyltransferase involved in cell wall biosynthesis
MTIVVVDDNSTDQTKEVVHRASQGDPRVHLLAGRPLPAGWAGKPFACWQGVQAARDPQWLCFLDADTAAHPMLLNSALRFAVAQQVDMLSLEPFQELGSLWERLILPAGMFLLAFTKDLRRINDPASSDAAANGQCLLIRRDVYEAVGGFAAVRGDLCEDTALARVVKRQGFRLALMGGEQLLRVRMYVDLRSLWEGVVKNVVEMAGGIPHAIGAAVFSLLLAWAPLAVPWYAWSRAGRNADALHYGAATLATLGSAAFTATHLAGARHFCIPIPYGWLFPLGYTMVAAIAVDSVRRNLRGRLTWKGRGYKLTGKRMPS